eukprot:4875198-Pleurochrysis_carterae.AAC.6
MPAFQGTSLRRYFEAVALTVFVYAVGPVDRVPVTKSLLVSQNAFREAFSTQWQAASLTPRKSRSTQSHERSRFS